MLSIDMKFIPNSQYNEGKKLTKYRRDRSSRFRDKEDCVNDAFFSFLLWLNAISHRNESHG